jgi:hypothetical protein
LLLGERLELHHETTLDQVPVGGSELFFDRFRLSALCFVDTQRLVAVVVSLMLLAEEFYLVAHKRKTHHDTSGVVVDRNTLFDNLLLKGFLKTLGFFSRRLAAHGTVAARVAPKIGNVSYIPFIDESFQFGQRHLGLETTDVRFIALEKVEASWEVVLRRPLSGGCSRDHLGDELQFLRS